MLALLLQLLGMVLLCIIIVLQSIRWYFRIPQNAYIVMSELGTWDEIRENARRPAVLDNAALSEVKDLNPPNKIPKIIHQTWKTEVLPERWVPVRDECIKMHPDYQYILWTDESARELIESEYPWFLPVYDSYPYNIQRADAIRYFVLHKYGGIYMDLDIGCARPMDPLLRFAAIFPRTIPVGISNDLILASKGHPFLDLLIHSLASFNHAFLTPYATVMFSTGPMFVSALYHRISGEGKVRPSTPAEIDAGFDGVRILPKVLYGKNVRESEVPDSFYRHFYGSSWHAGDADFLIFMRDYGYVFIFAGLLLIALFQARFIRKVLMFVYYRLWRRDGYIMYSPVTQQRGNAALASLKYLFGEARQTPHNVDVPIISLPSTQDSEKSVRSSYDSIDHERRLSADQILSTYADGAVHQKRQSLPAYYVDTQCAHELEAQDADPYSPSVSLTTPTVAQSLTGRFSRMRRAVSRGISAPLTYIMPSTVRGKRNRPRRNFSTGAIEQGDLASDRLSVVSVVSRNIDRNTDNYWDPGDDAYQEWSSLVKVQPGSHFSSPALEAYHSSQPSPVPSPIPSIVSVPEAPTSIPPTRGLHPRNRGGDRAPTPASLAPDTPSSYTVQ